VRIFTFGSPELELQTKIEELGTYQAPSSSSSSRWRLDYKSRSSLEHLLPRAGALESEPYDIPSRARSSELAPIIEATIRLISIDYRIDATEEPRSYALRELLSLPLPEDYSHGESELESLSSLESIRAGIGECQGVRSELGARSSESSHSGDALSVIPCLDPERLELAREPLSFSEIGSTIGANSGEHPEPIGSPLQRESL